MSPHFTLLLLFVGLVPACDSSTPGTVPFAPSPPLTPDADSPPIEGDLELHAVSAEPVTLHLAGPAELEVPPLHGAATTLAGLVVYRAPSTQAAVDDAFVVRTGGDSLRVVVHVAPPPPATLPGTVAWFDATREPLLDREGGEAREGGEVARWQSALGSADAANGQGALRAATGLPAAPTAVRFLGTTRFSTLAKVPQGPFSYSVALRIPEPTSDGPGAPMSVVAAQGGRTGVFVLAGRPASRAFRQGAPTEWVTRRAPHTGWTVVTGRWTGEWHELTINGEVANALPFPPEAVDGFVTLGDSDASSDRGFTGDVGEVIVHAGALSDGDRRRVDRYLVGKWLGHSRHVGDPSEAELIEGAGTLEGGDGDRLRGSVGADWFVITARCGTVIIDAFEPHDRLDVTHLLAGQADALEQVVRITPSLADAANAGCPPASAEVLIDGRVRVCLGGAFEVSIGQLVTDLETAPEGELTLELVNPRGEPVVATTPSDDDGGLHVGDEATLRLVRTGATTASPPPSERPASLDCAEPRSDLAPAPPAPGTPTGPQQVVHPRLRFEVSNALVDRDGRVRAVAPGPLNARAVLGGLIVPLAPLMIAPPRALPFEEEAPVVLGTPPGAYQGGVSHLGSWYCTANVTGVGPRLFRYDASFAPLGEPRDPGPGAPFDHAGGVGGHADRLYVAFLDSAQQGTPTARTGIAAASAETLEPLDFFDTSEAFGYLDALAVHDGALWVSSGANAIRIPIGPTGPELAARTRYSLWSGLRQLQGLAVRDGWLYAVPESTTSPPELMGIAVFDLARLEPDVVYRDDGLTVSQLFQAESLNVPVGLYRVELPKGAPDHESVFVDPDHPQRVYLPWIPGGAQLARLTLTHPTR